METYIAPPPPTDEGRIVAIDAHPDTFTLELFTGQTPNDARKLGTARHDSLQSPLQWARAELKMPTRPEFRDHREEQISLPFDCRPQSFDAFPERLQDS